MAGGSEVRIRRICRPRYRGPTITPIDVIHILIESVVVTWGETVQFLPDLAPPPAGKDEEEQADEGDDDEKKEKVLPPHELFQPVRTFLLSGVYPHASIYLMLIFRVVFFLAIGICLLVDVEFVYEQPISWVYFPTNWLNLLTFVYFLLLLVATYLSPIEMEVKFEPGPISPLYLVIWNIFHIVLPLVGTAWVANDTVVKSHDQAYSATLITAFFCMMLDTWLGAYMAHMKLIAAPLFVLLVFFLYTLLVDCLGGLTLYRALDWCEKPTSALGYAIELVMVQMCFSVVWFLLLSAKNDVWGIFHYRQAPKKALKI